MLQLSSSFIGQPVLSLQTGGSIAIAETPIINPNNLKIVGFYCQDSIEKRRPILLEQDIRDILPQGIVVNDYSVLTDATELVRLKEILEIGFQLIGKTVVTVTKQRLGKITDFAADSQTLYIQKLYVSQSLFKSLSNGQLGIDRTQIVEITNSKIIVQDLQQLTRSAVPVGLPAS